MSHFSVLVIGKGIDEVEEALLPYKENNNGDTPQEYLEWNSVEDEYLNEYENDTRSEFYCDSNSSWGKRISQKNYDKLKNGNIGDYFVFNVGRAANTFLECVEVGYFKKGSYYRTYYKDKHEAPTDDELIWINVVDVLETNHPDKDVCFEGKIRVKIVDEPKKIPLKNFYESFEDFMKNWAGYESKDEEMGEYGYWANPNAKWDWYQVGGRFRDAFKLKSNSVGMKGKKQNKFVGALYSESKKGWCDSARKCDIDWPSIHLNEDTYFRKALREWEMIVEGDDPKNDEEKELLNGNLWFTPEYYKKTYKDKETYAQCRSSFTTWAVITEDGEWFEKGEMGWFGISNETEDERVDWELNMYKHFIEPLDKNTILTVVDCHI